MIFGAARPRTHPTGRCRAFRGQRRPAPASQSARGGQGGLPGAGPSGEPEPRKILTKSDLRPKKYFSQNCSVRLLGAGRRWPRKARQRPVECVCGRAAPNINVLPSPVMPRTRRTRPEPTRGPSVAPSPGSRGGSPHIHDLFTESPFKNAHAYIPPLYVVGFIDLDLYAVHT